MVPCVDRAWGLELQPEKRTWREHSRILRALRRERFDVAFNFSGADRTIFLAALTGARWRVAHAGARRHFWNSWLIPDWVPRRPAYLPVPEQRLQVLAACGLSPGPARWDLRIPDAATRRAESLVPSNALHFSINASTPLKEWPLDHWIVLTKRLLAMGPQVRIAASGSGQSREQSRLQTLAAGVNNPRLIVLPADLSIAELAAVLRRCRGHLGADSGVLHLAVAVGLPTVSLFRDYHDAAAWMPAGPDHRVLSAPCVCVNQRLQPCAGTGRAECLAQLTPVAVAEAVHASFRPTA
jgi:ADP-heptose:LPS heptosyltransferase